MHCTGERRKKKTADGSISGVYPDLSMIYRVQLCRATDEWNPKGGHSKTRIDSGGYPHSEFQQPVKPTRKYPTSNNNDNDNNDNNNNSG